VLDGEDLAVSDRAVDVGTADHDAVPLACVHDDASFVSRLLDRAGNRQRLSTLKRAAAGMSAESALEVSVLDRVAEEVPGLLDRGGVPESHVPLDAGELRAQQVVDDGAVDPAREVTASQVWSGVSRSHSRRRRASSSIVAAKTSGTLAVPAAAKVEAPTGVPPGVSGPHGDGERGRVRARRRRR
jgi:hypothetical protein